MIEQVEGYDSKYKNLVEAFFDSAIALQKQIKGIVKESMAEVPTATRV